MKSLIPNKVKTTVKLFLRNCQQSALYFVVEGRWKDNKEKSFSHVVFVCKGNVCRSVFAEERLKHLVGANNKTIESFGLEVNQGGFPPLEAVNIAMEFGCDLSYKKAKGLDNCDLKDADLVLPMQYSQYKQLVTMLPEKKDKIRLLRVYAPFPFCLFCNIDDPYGLSEDGFRKTYKLIDAALSRLTIPFRETSR